MSFPQPIVSSSNTGDQSGGSNVTPATNITDRRYHHVRRPTHTNMHSRSHRFEGRSEELKGHVYDCVDARQADQYMKTTKEIAEFIGRTYKFGMDTRLSIENMQLTTIPRPDNPPEDADRTDIRIWEKSVDDYVKRKTKLSENNKTAYSLIWGQCSDVMRQRVESTPEFTTIAQNGEAIELLKIIKDISYNYQIQKYAPQALYEAKKRFYSCHQLRNQSTQAYFEYFQNQIEVITHIGGSIGKDPLLMNKLAKNLGIETESLSESDKNKAQDEFFATVFLMGADRSRFGKLLDRLQNDYLQGHDGYPKTLSGAYHLLTNWKAESHQMESTSNNGVSFTTSSSPQNNVNPRNHRTNITCYRCGLNGHYANTCTAARVSNDRSNESTTMSQTNYNESGSTLLTTGTMDNNHNDETEFLFYTCQDQGVILSTTNQMANIPRSWILLNNQSTIDVFSNPKLLKNIRKSDSTMNIHSTGGISKTDMIGELPGYGTLWYHPDGIANILSLARVRSQGYDVTYSSKDDNTFKLIKKDGTARCFTQSPKELFYLDTALFKTNNTVLINTVADNQYKYSNRDYSRALLARKIQRIVGRPSTRQFLNILNNNTLPNSPVTYHDVMAAENIFGPDVGSLKGKTVRQTPEAVRINKIAMPEGLFKRYQNVTIAADIMYINKTAFFVTISRDICFATTEALKNQKNDTIMRAIHQVLNIDCAHENHRYHG
jgi:hypothetical protein